MTCTCNSGSGASSLVRNKIYYRSDMKIAIRLKAMYEDIVVDAAVPTIDWTCRIFTNGGEAVTVSQRDGQPSGWHERAGAIVIAVNNTGLWPGKVRAEFNFAVPDADFPDKVRNLVRIYDLGIALTANPADTYFDEMEVTIILPGPFPGWWQPSRPTCPSDGCHCGDPATDADINVIADKIFGPSSGVTTPEDKNDTDGCRCGEPATDADIADAADRIFGQPS